MKKRKSLLLLGTLCLFLAGCAAETPEGNSTPAEETGVIKIASKPMTEQFILTEMLASLISQETGLEVQITKGIGGGTTNIHPALLKGEFDLYPEYTGTAWNFVIKKDTMPEEAEVEKELKESYEALDLTWTSLYGFNNTFALAVRKEIADEYNLETYSDLAKVSAKMTFGANPDFYEKADGFNALVNEYGMKFEKTVDLDIGLKYQALANKEVDVINAFTTDAQLAVADVKILKDDKGYFKNYYCGTVVRMDTLEKYPKLLPALEKMNGILTDEAMAEMNYEVEVNGKDEKEVADAFLKGKGLLQ